MAQGDEHVIVAGQATAGFDLGVDVGDRPEEDEGLVDEMAAQVQELTSPG
jgi:hypothetical protein